MVSLLFIIAAQIYYFLQYPATFCPIFYTNRCRFFLFLSKNFLLPSDGNKKGREFSSLPQISISICKLSRCRRVCQFTKAILAFSDNYLNKLNICKRLISLFLDGNCLTEPKTITASYPSAFFFSSSSNKYIFVQGIEFGCSSFTHLYK